MKNAVISYIFKFNYLAASPIMLVCSVCKYPHQEEVSNCKRCGWSIQNDLEISPQHPILTTCIPTLVGSLTNKIIQCEKLNSILQDIDLQKSNNQKLDEIQEQFVDLKEIINNLVVDKLDSLLQNKQLNNVISKEKNKKSTLNNNDLSSSYTKTQYIAVKDNSESLTHNYTEPNNRVSLPNFINKNSNNNYQFFNSDRSTNSDSNLRDEPPEDSLYDSLSDRNINNNNLGSINKPEEGSFNVLSEELKSPETINSSENSEPETNSPDSYHNFYQLIKQGELEVTKVTVTKETMEKMRSGTQSQLEFANDRKGNYWIVSWQGVYCLIPKEKPNINQHQYNNFQRVFDCQNYQETYRDFEVIKPATVISCDREIWQLERKGKIKFI